MREGDGGRVEHAKAYRPSKSVELVHAVQPHLAAKRIEKQIGCNSKGPSTYCDWQLTSCTR
jgi:hypothetical protein